MLPSLSLVPFRGSPRKRLPSSPCCRRGSHLQQGTLGGMGGVCVVCGAARRPFAPGPRVAHRRGSPRGGGEAEHRTPRTAPIRSAGNGGSRLPRAAATTWRGQFSATGAGAPRGAQRRGGKGRRGVKVGARRRAPLSPAGAGFE